MADTIVREGSSRRKLVLRWQSPVAAGARLIVGEGEIALFVRGGRSFGELKTGEYYLSPAQLPLMNQLMVDGPDGAVLDGELYFVSDGVRELKLHADLDFMDRSSRVRVLGSAEVRVSVRLTDPTRFILGALALTDHPDFESWFGEVTFNSVRSALMTHGRGPEQFPELLTVQRLPELGERCKAVLDGGIAKYAVEVKSFVLKEISLNAATVAAFERVERKRMMLAKVPGASPEPAELLPSGEFVTVTTTDGIAHRGVVKKYERGHYQIEWESGFGTTWVEFDLVKPSRVSD